MGSKQELQQQSGKLLDVNRQIVEMKKKIQLSEGQRKALFEEYELERKSNAEEIARLKKEIGETVAKLREKRSTSAKNRVDCARLEQVLGHVGDKNCEEVVQALDLLIIDKSKQLDLLRYQAKKKQSKLSTLADEYKTAIVGKIHKRTRRKIDKAIKKKIRELQNNVHAVQVQKREAEHVNIRYAAIKAALHEDAVRFESNVEQIQEQLAAQQSDIRRLQQICAEAGRMRGNARGVLLKEEKAALKSASDRERREHDGKQKIIERRQEMEKLEKKIFHGKVAIRPETDVEDANVPSETITPQPIEEITQAFETLKEATGGTNTIEVLERFRSQKETFERLQALRTSGEDEKRTLDAKNNRLTAQLETLKFAEVKDSEENAEEVEKLQRLIANERQNKKLYVERASEIRTISKQVFEKLQTILLLHVRPDSKTNDPFEVLQTMEKELSNVADMDRNDELEVELNEDKWLPPPYSGLVRRTPLPQQGPSFTPVPPPGSDDEEEVPSRAFVKRQAQVVIDARLRRKTLRFESK